MERGVYFDAWFPNQHCYHPSLPGRRLRMIDHLVDYRATTLVWSAMGGGSIALPYLEEEAFASIDSRFRFYGFVNDSEFVRECQKHGIKVFGIVFEVQGWEMPAELNEDETQILASMSYVASARKYGWDCASLTRIVILTFGRHSRTIFQMVLLTVMAIKSPT